MTKEALRSWQVFTWYGLGQQSLLDLYPVLHTALHPGHGTAQGILPGLHGLSATPGNAIGTLGLYELACGAGAHGALEPIVEVASRTIHSALAGVVYGEAPGPGEPPALGHVAGCLRFVGAFYESLPDTALDMPMLEAMEAMWQAPLVPLCRAPWMSTLLAECTRELSGGAPPTGAQAAWWALAGLLDTFRTLLDRHRGVARGDDSLALLRSSCMRLVALFVERIAEFHAVAYQERLPETMAVLAAIRLGKLLESLSEEGGTTNQLLLLEAAVFAIPCLGPCDECLASLLVDEVVLHPTYLASLFPEQAGVLSAEQARTELMEALTAVTPSLHGGGASLAVSSRSARGLSSMFIHMDAPALPVSPDWLFTALHQVSEGKPAIPEGLTIPEVGSAMPS